MKQWAREHLRASQYEKIPGAVPSLVPAKQANGSCHWLQPDGHCAVHDNSPCGCAFLDQHMSDDEAQKRQVAGFAARKEQVKAKGLYWEIWTMLYEEGLINNGIWDRRREVRDEFRKVERKIAKRAEWVARRVRRKKRKKARQRKAG